MKKKTIYFLSIFILIISSSLKSDKIGLIREDFAVAEKQYAKMLEVSTNLQQYPRSINAKGNTTYTSISDWTGGFWPGCLWYVYEYTKSEKWKDAAIKWTESLEKNQYNTSNHDIGFMMNCSYGNAYRLTGNKLYKSILVQSAKSLISRFNPKVGAIKSWNSFKSWDGKSVYQFPVIIDNMMNLELLFYVSKLTGDNRYRDIAVKHAETTLKNHFRPDYSSYHVVAYDPETGKVLSRETCQGFSDNSAWARGQAWGLYGFTVVYRETKNKKFLNAALKIADFYLNNKNLPADKVPFWDYNVNQNGYTPKWKYNPENYKIVPRDASAAAITSSALFELCTYTTGKEREKLFNRAELIIQSLSSEVYRAQPGTNGFFILRHNVGGFPQRSEIDVPLIYSDYYFLEALLRYKRLLK
ncbi:MAG: glycoside hydrolase family 88 protein [Bacteroidota bacterium]|nr:glycoside hydrolase family 88 protein [Bacteroidota bacterium]